MSRVIQFKRAANTVVANTTGADGELIIDISSYALTVHDGYTLGGTRLATETFVSRISAANVANAAYYASNTANLALLTAQSAYAFANTVNAYAYSSNTFLQANDAVIWTYANSAYSVANIASANIALLINVNNTQNTSINAAFTQANSANILAQAAYNAANAAGSSTFTQAAFDKANSANILAQSAYAFANTVNVFTQSADDTRRNELPPKRVRS